MRKPRKNQRRLHCALLLSALLLPLGTAAAAGKALGKAKARSGKSQAADWRRGGIDPTTVPIIDEDLDFSIAPDPVVLLGDGVRSQLEIAAAHERATGAGIVVAVLDGGFDLDHPAVAGHFLSAGYHALRDVEDAHDVGNGIDDDGDGLVDRAVGHGTFVAGMIAAVAPDAWILPIAIRDDEGFGTNEETVRGLEYAWQTGADIVNLSISAAALDNAGISRTVRAMRRSGVAVVVSMGNTGEVWLNGLAGSRDTLAVASVEATDHVAPFSTWSLYNWPQQPIVYAPGTDLYGPLSLNDCHCYGWWSGTSFATGIVSGAAALALETYPGLAPLELYDLLETSVDPAWGPAGEDLDGLGRINLRKVVAP